jgi:ABC-type Fe3+-hydroxamate transport system substrate-binding protein
MPFYTDQLNRVVNIPLPPQRIVSVVPSQTELLCELGLKREVTGITRFCIHPEKWFREKERVGGTKNLNIEKIVSLQPDLIIANKEENVREQIEALAKDFPVWISDVMTLNDAYQMMQSIGEITARQQVADGLVSQIKTAFSQLQTPNTKPRTAYLIWKNPYMTVGGDTFIHHLMEEAGFQNVFADRLRYPEVLVENLRNAGCDLLLLSSEPYPFKQTHVNELRQHLPQTKIALVDGEMFSWYGSRLLQAPAYFKTLHERIVALA